MKQSELKNYIGEGVTFEGEIEFVEEMSIFGEVFGKITGTGTLIQGIKGVIEGEVNVNEFISEGHFKGDIRAQSVHLKKGSYTEGEVFAENCKIDSGAGFNLKLISNKPNKKTSPS